MRIHEESSSPYARSAGGHSVRPAKAHGAHRSIAGKLPEDHITPVVCALEAPPRARVDCNGGVEGGGTISPCGRLSSGARGGGKPPGEEKSCSVRKWPLPPAAAAGRPKRLGRSRDGERAGDAPSGRSVNRASVVVGSKAAVGRSSSPASVAVGSSSEVVGRPSAVGRVGKPAIRRARRRSRRRGCVFQRTRACLRFPCGRSVALQRLGASLAFGLHH